MKKGLLIYRINKDDPTNFGVIKKCEAQQKAFMQHGFGVDMLWLCKEGVLKNEELIIKANIPPHSLKVYWFYFLRFGKIIKAQVQKGGYDFIYLRHPFFDPLLVQSLREIKQIFPGIKIFLEINTYPYDAEPKRLLHKLSLKIDQYYRKTAHEYIDRIVDYGQRETIWGIPTISVRNGIDVESVRVSNSIPEEGKLRLIAVGNWSYWHGLDRVLRGMNTYFKNGGRDVLLKIIGEGSAIKSSKSFIKMHHLEEFIELSEPMDGAKLDECFEETDIGIGTIGLHRKKVVLNSSLKHRTYCARGIPFIFSGEDSDFPMGLNFVRQVEDEDSEISIEEVKIFFDQLKSEWPDYRSEMRRYAEEKLTWKNKLAVVMNEI